MPKRKRREGTFEPAGLMLRAELKRESIDREERTADLTFYTGAEVLRGGGFFSDPIRLSFDVKGMKLDRLNSGAPLLDSHNSSALEHVIGVVEKAWLEGGSARARVRFSKRDAVEPVWQDVLDGVIRNISMGTHILEMEEITERGDELDRFVATSSEPFELSLLPVGADPGAHLEEMSAGETRTCKIQYRAEALADAPKGDDMKKEVRLLVKCELGEVGEIVEIEEEAFDKHLHSEDLTGAPKKPKKVAAAADTDLSDDDDADDAVSLDIANEAKRAARIKKIGEHYGLDTVWVQRHVNLNTEIDVVLGLAKKERAERAPRSANDIGFGDDYDNAVWRSEQMAEAIVARAKRTAPPEEARQYAHASLLEIACEALSWDSRHRLNARRDDPMEIVRLALHTTSDFPNILANVLNKIMLPAYTQADPTYRRVAAQRSFNDFRAHSFLRRGDFPVPQKVNEHGEYQHGTMSENAESVTPATYGRIIGFSRQSMINDDVGAFDDIGVAAGQRVADFENSHFFTTLILAGAGLGPALDDGDTVYHANHANATGAGALDVGILGEGRALMMAQTSLDGLKLNINPSLLLVSPDSLTLAEQLTTSVQGGVPLVGQGASASPAPGINPFAGKLTPIGDANLTGTRFYLLSDPGRNPNYVWGYLAGQSGPSTEVRNGFDVDGVEFKVSLDFGVGAIDYRGGVTGAGA